MKKLTVLLITFFFLIFFTLNSSPGLAAWPKYTNNPVLDIGSPGNWDDQHTFAPSVIYHQGIYKMWYAGYGTLNSLTAGRIGYATSTDGIHWSKHLANPVVDVDLPGSWEKHIGEPNVIYDANDSLYKMWFTSTGEEAGQEAWRISYATSTDGISWDKHGSVLYPTSGSWDARGDVAPCVLKIGSQYTMWFMANNNGTWQIGRATSTDGINWEKFNGNPILSPLPPESPTIAGPDVIKPGDNYLIVYNAKHPPSIINMASSADGISNWVRLPEPENPILALGQNGSFDDTQIAAPNVLKKGDLYRLWYAGYDGARWRIGYAETGLAPTVSPTLAPEPTPTLSPEPTATPTLEPSTPTPTEPLPTMSESPTPTPSVSPSPAPSESPTPTLSPSPTLTPTLTLTATLTPTLSLTPSLSPTPSLLPPIVLLPGLGASWNHKNLILGIEQPQSEWYMTPGVKVYDNLIQTLKNAGYKTDGENKNLFIFNYNWTKPIEMIVADLDNYIKNTVRPTPGVQIDLLGHSLGGLVARAYIQNNPNHQADKLLTAGAPHKGVSQVYYLWEGGDLSKSLPDWQRIPVSLLIHLRSPGFSTTASAIKSVFPGLKNILPTFNYLKQNHSEKQLELMKEKNDWLMGLNSLLPNHLISSLNSISGSIPNSTLRWIQVVSPNWLDNILNLWPDGKPNGTEEFFIGDRTVLTESALLGTHTYDLTNLDHRELVESVVGQQKIMEILELSPSAISTKWMGVFYEPSLIFQLESPAFINSIIDPSGQSSGFTDGNLAIVPNSISGQYSIKISGTGQGNYHLHIGQIIDSNDLWFSFYGTISSGQEINHKIEFNPTSPLEYPLVDPSGEEYLKNAKNKISDLKALISKENLNSVVRSNLMFYLENSLYLLNAKKTENAISTLYQLRKQINFYMQRRKLNEEKARYFRNKTQEICNDLEYVYILFKSKEGSTYNPFLLNQEIISAQLYFKKMESQLRKSASLGKGSPDMGVLYLLALKKLNLAKSSSSYKGHIYTSAAQNLSLEGLNFLK